MVVLASRIYFSEMFYDINEYTNINSLYTVYNYKMIIDINVRERSDNRTFE